MVISDAKGGSTRVLLALLVVVTSSCIDINMRTQPEDTSVREVLFGDDCVPIVLGMGFGTATIEPAKANGKPFAMRQSVSTTIQPKPIVKIRRVETEEMGILFFGSRCIQVTGE
jgi:hypothetical protein